MGSGAWVTRIMHLFIKGIKGIDDGPANLF